MASIQPLINVASAVGVKAPQALPAVTTLFSRGFFSSRSSSCTSGGYYGQDRDPATTTDVSDLAPERDPNAVKGEYSDKEAVAKAEANLSVDSMRHMAGKVNQAVGGSYDFEKTGGTTIRDMASEIADNMGEPIRKMAEKGSSMLDSAADKASSSASAAADKASGAANKAAGAAAGEGVYYGNKESESALGESGRTPGAGMDVVEEAAKGVGRAMEDEMRGSGGKA